MHAFILVNINHNYFSRKASNVWTDTFNTVGALLKNGTQMYVSDVFFYQISVYFILIIFAIWYVINSVHITMGPSRFNNIALKRPLF